MTMPISDWHPEQWIDDKWLVVRYRPMRVGVFREVYPPMHSAPEWFATEQEALNVCQKLSGGRDGR